MPRNVSFDHPVLGRLTIEAVEPERTYLLRQSVLRPHQRIDEMSLLGGADGDAAVMAAVTGAGEVIGTAAVMPEAAPAGLAPMLPPGPAWRLRSMATRADVQGGGIGRVVLDAALDHVAERGGAGVWCNARVRAVAFYERAGFRTFGDTWNEEHIGLHVRMWCAVTGGAS